MVNITTIIYSQSAHMMPVVAAGTSHITQGVFLHVLADHTMGRTPQC